MMTYQVKQRTPSQTLLGFATACSWIVAASPATTAELAYWRFEAGPADTDVVHTADPGYPNYSEDVADSSGSGNELSMWETGGGAGFAYRTDVANSTIPQTGQANNFSIKNTGGGPASFTEPSGTLSSVSPAAWTIEASFKVESGGHRTIVGRDAQNIAAADGGLAALYLQVRPDDNMAIAFTDADGFFHVAESTAGVVDRFDFGSDPDGQTVSWYNVAAVSDGSTLSLYLDEVDSGNGYQLVAQTDMTLSGSTNTSLNNGASGTAGAGDWSAGEWTVGRGLYGGGHVDRAYGFIDEVRINDEALEPSDFLFFETQQTLTLEVNTTTGMVTLRNDSASDITFDYYEITSDNNPGALDEGGWSSLDSQGVDAAQQGDFNSDGAVDAADYTTWRDGLGTEYSPSDYDTWRANYGESGSGGLGWTESGGSDANILSELFLEGDGSTLAPGEELSLGAAFDASVFGAGQQGDLEFRFGSGSEALLIGNVSYVSSESSPAAAPEPQALLLGLLTCVARIRIRQRS